MSNQARSSLLNSINPYFPVDHGTEVIAPPNQPASADQHIPAVSSLEVSIVMPCLNEAMTVGLCVEKAVGVLRSSNIQGEIIVCDNGSTDGSIEIAQGAGARLVHQPLRGYGSAYIKGIEAARGHYILIADSDNTYDFADLPRFLDLLKNGYELVNGNRFKGSIMPGAMPWAHRYIGNPVLSGLLNLFFHTGIGDAHCGMRAFTKEAYWKMRLQTTGMEFASEMVIHAAKAGLKMGEVPINYFPRVGESKLSSLRDGWRHLRFMLLYSPTHLYLLPGAIATLLGFLILFSIALGPIRIAGVEFGLHWMFIGGLLAILGVQLIEMGFFARVFSLTSHIDKGQDRIVSYFSQAFRLEGGILIGFTLLGLGMLAYASILFLWLADELEILRSVRLGILALTLSVIGVQTIFASFFISMMVIKRRGWGS